MSTGFAEEMESYARGFINELINEKEPGMELYGDDLNFKPWYSPRWMFDEIQSGSGRLLVGTNPGGDPAVPDDTTGRDYEQTLDSRYQYNAFLDESWNHQPKGESDLQCSVRKVFKRLYGESRGDDELRRTACFNVSPIRSKRVNDLPERAWPASVKWFKEVVKPLRPNTIICIGSAKNGKSPWVALEADQIWCHKIAKNATLRFGTTRLTASHKAKVIAIPHPTGAAFNRDYLYQVLSCRRDELIHHEATAD